MREVLPILDFDDSSYDPFAMDETAFGEIEEVGLGNLEFVDCVGAGAEEMLLF